MSSKSNEGSGYGFDLNLITISYSSHVSYDSLGEVGYIVRKKNPLKKTHVSLSSTNCSAFAHDTQMNYV
jgi:hypothetical protein